MPVYNFKTTPVGFQSSPPCNQLCTGPYVSGICICICICMVEGIQRLHSVRRGEQVSPTLVSRNFCKGNTPAPAVSSRSAVHVMALPLQKRPDSFSLPAGRSRLSSNGMLDMQHCLTWHDRHCQSVPCLFLHKLSGLKSGCIRQRMSLQVRLQLEWHQLHTRRYSA